MYGCLQGLDHDGSPEKQSKVTGIVVLFGPAPESIGAVISYDFKNLARQYKAIHGVILL
jgi:hypothetical protein